MRDKMLRSAKRGNKTESQKVQLKPERAEKEEEERSKEQIQQMKIITNLVEINATISITTLNVNGLNKLKTGVVRWF